MKKVMLIVFSLILLALSIIGCGVPIEQYKILHAENADLLTERGVLVAERERLVADKDALTAENEALATENRNLKTQLNRKSLPPAHFIDRQELAVWRNATGMINSGGNYIDDVLLIQREALKDGKILSIDLDWDDTTENWTVMLTVMAGDKFYTVYPDDLTITYFADVN